MNHYNYFHNQYEILITTGKLSSDFDLLIKLINNLILNKTTNYFSEETLENILKDLFNIKNLKKKAQVRISPTHIRKWSVLGVQLQTLLQITREKIPVIVDEKDSLCNLLRIKDN